MGIKDKKNLRVVEGYKGSAKKTVKYYVDRIGEGIRKLGGDFRKNVIIAAVVFAVGIALFLFVNLRTYSSVTVTDTKSIAGAADSSYQEFAGGILKYSRDGISFLDMNGEEQWNYPYQIKTPFVEVNNVSAAVACKGGNDIMIFQKDGVKGEIHTTLPIEKISVSEQGIVSAILKNESAPKVICYDAVGNILVEHNVSLAGMGYPMDVAISANGEVLQVSYLHVSEGKLLSKVAYYNFGKAGESAEDHQIAYEEFENTVLATGFYMDKNTSVVIGDNCLTIFKGQDKINKVANIAFDKEIQSIGYSEKYIAIVLINSGETGYELRMYNKAGKMVTSETFAGNYRHIKITGNHVLMYDGKECCIFLKGGLQKFEGEMHEGIMEIVPISGLNKYTVMTSNGMESVRLTN